MAAVMIALQHKQDAIHGVRGSEERERVFLSLTDDDQDNAEGFTMREPKHVGSLDKLVLSAVVKEDGSPFSWQPRCVMMDENVVAFTHISEKRIIDYIPLGEIRGVQRIEDLEQNIASASRLPMQKGGLQKAGGKFPFRRGSNAANSDFIESGIESTTWSGTFGTEMSREDSDRAFEILTEEHGHNSGRSYRLRAANQQECDIWMERINAEIKIYMSKHSAQGQGDRVASLRHWLARIYKSEQSQIFISFLIIANFIISVASTEVLPEHGSTLATMFETVEDVFTIIFLVELLLNLFINWFFAFFQDLWNIFDLLVISGSVVTMFVSGPGLAILRLVRVFRVLRVIKRLYALRRIINALTKSMIPMVNAFTVLFLVASIYSTLAVFLFGERSPILFGSFSAAFFTMFQVCTMDDWGETARSLSDDRTVDWATGVFFVSFVILVGIVILNVVVAVLLDEFVESVTEDREQRIQELLSKRQERQKTYGSPLDPVLDGLAHYNTSLDLTERIHSLFQALDIDNHGELTFRELKEGLRKLKTEQHIHLSEEDYNVITYDKEWCNRKGLLGMAEFERVMRDQLKLYVQRQMARSMVAARCAGSQVADILFVLKQLMVSLDDLHTNDASCMQDSTRRGESSPLPNFAASTRDSPLLRTNSGHAFGVRQTTPVTRTESPPPTGPDIAAKLDEAVELLKGQGQAVAALCERVDQLTRPRDNGGGGTSALEFKPVMPSEKPEGVTLPAAVRAEEVAATLLSQDWSIAAERTAVSSRPETRQGGQEQQVGGERGVGPKAEVSGREAEKPDPARWSWTHKGGREPPLAADDAEESGDPSPSETSDNADEQEQGQDSTMRGGRQGLSPLQPMGRRGSGRAGGFRQQRHTGPALRGAGRAGHDEEQRGGVGLMSEMNGSGGQVQSEEDAGRAQCSVAWDAGAEEGGLKLERSERRPGGGRAGRQTGERGEAGPGPPTQMTRRGRTHRGGRGGMAGAGKDGEGGAGGRGERGSGSEEPEEDSSDGGVGANRGGGSMGFGWHEGVNRTGTEWDGVDGMGGRGWDGGRRVRGSAESDLRGYEEEMLVQVTSDTPGVT